MKISNLLFWIIYLLLIAIPVFVIFWLLTPLFVLKYIIEDEKNMWIIDKLYAVRNIIKWLFQMPLIFISYPFLLIAEICATAECLHYPRVWLVKKVNEKVMRIYSIDLNLWMDETGCRDDSLYTGLSARRLLLSDIPSKYLLLIPGLLLLNRVIKSYSG